MEVSELVLEPHGLKTMLGDKMEEIVRVRLNQEVQTIHLQNTDGLNV